ncbi:RAM signaling pathway protein-domain-containing protein [Microdochium trichocladiopsis]|uniref:RAM signaling pathway protein-domain-containing protein n=1 Tax=Microdochium trichocladiopsis TaxID=1682393 RepID=A0A9P8YF96_9PEZI|nr:RAM signaling pathway protein-domain-containing protein [Microdochium trichocladiopsis]KAH7040697.1 RAM signaling pathway protein-domain-containing protein [Microdochium trichocladiopsis]
MPPPPGRGLPLNPSQTRRVAAPPATAILAPQYPSFADRQHHPQNSSASNLSATSISAPLSSNQVINIAREAMNNALLDNESQAAEASGVSNELKPGITIDLSRRNIQELPEGVVDIIKHELERLALSHNRLSSFPARFAECTTLRYLNVRNNQIKEFPQPLCELRSLEILDLGRNRIRVLPPEIAKLTSLKVLAVQRNRIEELPLCLADMVSLQVLKLDGNNITFPPREVFQFQAASPPNDGQSKESEVTELAMTAHLKRYLRQCSQSLNEKEREIENGDDFLDTGDAPRAPLKRVVSGRFPVKVSGSSDSSERLAPSTARLPMGQARLHSRGLSQQSTTIRRPGVMPLTIGNPHERLRSNSETMFHTPKLDRPSERQRRMAMASKRANDLGTLDETQANNRFSHYRGLSHGSSMTGHLNPGNNNAISSLNSPADPLLQRPYYVRRLSVLPEQRRESKMFDPIIESAKGILYSIFQIHPMIQLFTRLTGDGTARRSSLEIVFYNTNMHVEELEVEIQKHEDATERGVQAPRENENIQRAVLTLVNAYSHICSLLVNNMDNIVDNGDPRYIRTMMMLLYNSIMELRVTANEATIGLSLRGSQDRANAQGFGETIRPIYRESASATPTADRPAGGPRSRTGTLVQHPSSNLRVATDVPVPHVHLNGRIPQIASATPRSGESFASIDSRFAADFNGEERIFDKIFLSLQKSTDLVMRTLPSFNMQFNAAKTKAEAERQPEHIVQCWRGLSIKCTVAIRETEILKNRLSRIKLKEPGIRTDPGFWTLCKSFIDAWAEYGSKLKSSMDLVQLSPDIRSRLRPIQVGVKETNQLIMASPWANLFRQAGSYADHSNMYSPVSTSSGMGMGPGQMPMTPQSAALGPAVQATVPATPQSASFAHAFNGNVFERANAFISMGGLTMSRSGTMTSASSLSLTSASSMSSMYDDRYAGPGPNGFQGSSVTSMPQRFHGGSKPSF